MTDTELIKLNESTIGELPEGDPGEVNPYHAPDIRDDDADWLLGLLIKMWFAIVCVSVASTFVITLALVKIDNTNDRRELQEQFHEGLITEEEMAHEILIDKSYGGMGMMVMTFLVLIMSAVTTIPIFLNGAEKFMRNKWLRFLSFFLGPSAVVACACAEGVDMQGVLMFLPFFVPFWVCLTIAYILFSRKIDKTAYTTTEDL
jgi:hypothetical protein